MYSKKKTVSQPSSFRNDTQPDPQQHADSTPLPDSTRPHSHSTDNDTDSSEYMDLSANKNQPRSSTPNPEVTVTKKHCTASPIRCEARQREQNAYLPALDFSDSSIESYVKMHHYLSVCNCPICIKKLFEHKITSRNASKCQCTTCQPYWFYEGGHISDLQKHTNVYSRCI